MTNLFIYLFIYEELGFLHFLPSLSVKKQKNKTKTKKKKNKTKTKMGFRFHKLADT